MRRILVSVFVVRVATLVFFFLLLPLPLCPQQIGASITGHVFDPSEAAVSGADIKVTSTTTGSVYTAGSDSAGIYQLPFVPIGTYTLTVEKPGFKRYVQQGIALVAAQKAVIDITLELGAVTQLVSVVANAPILQPESGDRSATISNTRLDPEVFRGQNTIVTTWFTPGVTLTQAVQKIRPWDNLGTQGENINGGQSGQGGNLQTGQSSGNQVMVNGISISRGGNGTGFNAIASSVDQVTVVGTLYDAQYGWSTGGHINTITKGGANQWHGHGYDYLQNTMFNAEDWTSKIAGTGRLPWHINMYGGEIGGPLKKDKFFIYTGYQMIWQVQRDPETHETPTAAMRQGNFNGVLFGGNQLTLYDPSTTSNCSSSSLGTACRSTSGPLVSGNVIQQINPIAAKVMSFMSPPNTTGVTSTCPSGVTSAQAGGLCGTFAGNLVSGPNSRKYIDYFPEYTGRADWNLSDKTHAFFQFSKNDLWETRNWVYSTVSYLDPADTTQTLFRGNQFYDLQVTHTFNPTTVLEFRHGMDRYPNGNSSASYATFDPTALGFSSTFAGEATHIFPVFSILNFAGAGTSVSAYTASDIWTTEAVLAHTHGRHNLRVGFQRFDLADYSESTGFSNGYFGFDGDYTSANPYAGPGTSGYSLADFELGFPTPDTTNYINEPAYPEYWEHEYSLFVQDDWHVNRKFTLNLGLRWDYEGPVSDKYNRLLNGFCATCENPLGYVGSYTNYYGTTATVGELMGGPTFAGVGGAPSGIFHRKFDNFGPRIGFAYDLGHDTVLRGGWGIIYGQQLLEPGAAPGFSNITVLNAYNTVGIYDSTDYPLSNPFPRGLSPIVGSANGLATNVGKTITFPDPDLDIPRTQQYSLEVQHSLGHNWMFSLAYVGSRAARLNVNRQLEPIPLSYLPFTPSFAPNPTGYSANALSYKVNNPFLAAVPASSPYSSLLTGTPLANATIAQYLLLFPYPEFTSVQENYVPIGTSHFNSMQLEVNKRLSVGLEFGANFTWSKLLQATGFLNPQDPAPAQTLAPFDCPRQVKVNMAYFAPFGPGKRFLNQANPLVSRLVSGWSLSATPMIMDGYPAPTPPNVMPTGAPETTPHPTLSHWFNTCVENAAGTGVYSAGLCSIDTTPAWKIMQTWQLYEWSPYMHGVRYVGDHRLDAGIKKETTIKERYQLTYRADFINAFNSSEWNSDLVTSYASNTFGMVGYPANVPSDDPRVIMMSLQIKF